MSPAMKLLTLVWNHGSGDTWERTNHSMRNALELAIGSGLRFALGDLDNMGQFRWGHWVGSSDEWIYSMAIVTGNESCIKEYERYRNRTPFRANNVSDPRYDSAAGYLHANSIARQRERLAVGFGVPIDGKQWWVTSFDDAKGTVRLASYEKHWPEGKPKKLRTLTHEECATLFPAPKKAKAQASQIEKGK